MPPLSIAQFIVASDHYLPDELVAITGISPDAISNGDKNGQRLTEKTYAIALIQESPDPDCIKTMAQLWERIPQQIDGALLKTHQEIFPVIRLIEYSESNMPGCMLDTLWLNRLAKLGCELSVEFYVLGSNDQ